MIDEYLKRIGYDGPHDATLPTLRALHLRHLLTVPFENLDIHVPRMIVLDEARIIDKIVRQHRGGFCYELNGAFAALLRALGFDVTLLSARVVSADGKHGPEFDHMTLLVRIDGKRWLADVGFGESFLLPLSFDEPDDSGYRLQERDGEWGMQALRDGVWKDDYLFTLTPRALADYEPMCRFHSTSPESHFSKGPLCSIATENGRITVQRDRIIVTENGEKRQTPIGSDEEWREALQRYFGVVLP